MWNPKPIYTPPQGWPIVPPRRSDRRVWKSELWAWMRLRKSRYRKNDRSKTLQKESAQRQSKILRIGHPSGGGVYSRKIFLSSAKKLSWAGKPLETNNIDSGGGGDSFDNYGKVLNTQIIWQSKWIERFIYHFYTLEYRTGTF